MEQEKKEKRKNLKMYYEYSPNYNVVSPNDFSCMIFKNNVMVDFINELPRPPIVSIRNLKKDHTINLKTKPKAMHDMYELISNKISDENNIHYKKFIQNTISLSEDDALDLAYALISTVLGESEKEYDIKKIKEEFNEMFDEIGEKND